MKIAVIAFLLCAAAVARGADTLAKELEPLRPFIGKTWKGHFKDSTPEKPKVDVTKWERALNGRAIRILHSVNDGAYGGEAIVMWNRKTERIEYHYFTTAGITTHGVMKVDDNKLITRETVTGSEITEVEATHELTADGKMRVSSHYLKNGQRTGGREMVYEQDPNAQVLFK